MEFTQWLREFKLLWKRSIRLIGRHMLLADFNEGLTPQESCNAWTTGKGPGFKSMGYIEHNQCHWRGGPDQSYIIRYPSWIGLNMVEVRNFACFAKGDTLSQAKERFKKSFPSQVWDFLIVYDENGKSLFHCQSEAMSSELLGLEEYPNLCGRVKGLLV